MRIADESLPAGLMLHAFARAEGAFPRPLEGKVLLIKGLEATVFGGSPRAQACLSKGAEIIVLSDDGSTVRLSVGGPAKDRSSAQPPHLRHGASSPGAPATSCCAAPLRAS